MKESKRLSRILLSLILLSVLILPAYAEMGTSGTPKIMITSPKEGATIPAGNVTIMVNVTNFNLVNKLGKANVAGEGHVHYYIDVAVPKIPGKPATTPVGTFAPTYNTTWTWPNVKPGGHNFSVQLANNNHTPVIPLVYNTVNVTVEANTTLKTMAVQDIAIGLIAKNIAFNASAITVPAGANVTVNFDNQDTYIPHNFAVFTDSSATKAIFQGKIITGPDKIAYAFIAPSQVGTYFFRCDVHPTQMTGQFIVQ